MLQSVKWRPQSECYFCLSVEYRAKYKWKKIGKILKLIAVKFRYSSTSLIAHSTLWTEIPSYTLRRLTGLKLQLKNSGYLYPPDNIRLYSDWANISIRTFIVGNNAGKVVLKIVGSVHVIVSRSRTSKTVKILYLWHTSGD